MTSPQSPECVSVIRQLWDYLDGELDPARWEEIRAHLAMCTGCSAHVEFCRDFLARASSVPMNGGELAMLRDRVLTMLDAEAANG